jgi:hypothetical protein
LVVDPSAVRSGEVIVWGFWAERFDGRRFILRDGMMSVQVEVTRMKRPRMTGKEQVLGGGRVAANVDTHSSLGYKRWSLSPPYSSGLRESLLGGGTGRKSKWWKACRRLL